MSENFMKYPLWLPRPKAWGQVATLLLGWLPTSMIANYVATPVDYYRTQSFKDSQLGGMTMVVLTPLTIYCLSLSYQFIWTNDKLRWKPSLRAWLEGFWSFTITIISLVIGYGISYLLYKDLDYSDKWEDRASVGLFLTTILLAYLFYFRWLTYRLFCNIYSFFQKLTKPKIKVSGQSERKIDPIEVELNKLKSEMGLKQMKDVKKTD